MKLKSMQPMAMVCVTFLWPLVAAASVQAQADAGSTSGSTTSGPTASGSPTSLPSTSDRQSPLAQAQPWQIHSFYVDAKLSEKYLSLADFDAEGAIWIAVSDGLYRYDGYRWTRFTTEHGLPSNYVRCVTFAPDGTLWVGTDRGAGTFDNEVFDSHGSEGQLAGPSVRRIVVDPDGSVWFCCDKWPVADVPSGLTRLRDGKFRTWNQSDGLPSDYVSDYFRDSTGRQFVLTRKGLVQFSADRLIEPLVGAGLTSTDTYFWSIVESPVHGVVAATGKHFFQFKDGRWRQFANEMARLNQPKLLATTDGEIYTAPYGGGTIIYRWNDGKLIPASPAMTGISGGVQFLVEDPHGAVWVGGFERLVRWERTNAEWTKYAELGIPVLRDAGGALWFEDAQGLVRMESDQWTSFAGFTTPVLEDPQQRVWLQSVDGVAFWDGSQETQSVEIPSLSQLKLIEIDRGGAVWVQGLTEQGELGFARLKGDRWDVTSVAKNHANESVCSLHTDPQAGIWVVLGVNSLPPFRLLYLDGQGVKQAKYPERANASAPPAVTVHRDGTIWLGGFFGLLESSDSGDSWVPVEAPSNSVSQIQQLGDELWIAFSSHAGGDALISRYRDAQWTSLPNLHGRFFGRKGDQELYLASHGSVQTIPADSDEFPPAMTTPFPLRARRVVAGNDGEYWFGIGRDAFQYRPTPFAPETELAGSEKHVYEGDDLVLLIRGRERFKPGDRKQRFSVSTQVDGGSWSPFRPLERGTHLSNLPVGRHVLRARVQSESQLIDSTPAIIDFEVLPVPIQMRAWFKPVVLSAAVTIFCLALLAMFNWLTIRKLARGLKEEVVRRGERLDSSEREFQLLFEDSQDAICLFGVDGSMQACNGSAAELLDTSSAETPSMEQLFPDSGERARFQSELDRNGCLRGMRFRIRGKDAKEFDAIVSANIRGGGEGNVVGYQVIVRDISDLVELQRQLLEIQKMEAVGQMAGGIAHDFNNFLAVVMYGADFIRLQKHGDPDIEKGVQMIIDGAQRAKSLTSQIQTFSRAPSPKTGIIDTHQVLSKLPDLLESMLPGNVQLHLELADDLGRIHAESQQVEQVLINLAVNACHAMPDGGKLTIEAQKVAVDDDDAESLRLDAPGDFVRVTVTDTGHGIQDHVRERMFEPFFTTKPHGQGTGLGLAIVYGIVRQLRGHIRVDSCPGEGSCFEMLFPIRWDETRGDDAAEIELPVQRGDETILLVEDDDNIRRLVSRSLGSYGYDVRTAKDGASAIEQINGPDGIDLLISDIVMSGMSGFELVEHVRRMQPEVAILLVSGYPQRTENGVLDEIDVPFLRKPFAPSVLAARVRQILDAKTTPVST